jgi:hypothetical protein
MQMSGLLELLQERGLRCDALVKIVRHRDTRPGMSLDDLERDGWIEVYQSYQATRIFECDYLISSIGLPEGRSRLFGVYHVAERAIPTPQHKLPAKFPHQDFDDKGNYYYVLQRDTSFDDLSGLEFEWGARPKNWHLWLTAARDMAVRKRRTLSV